MQVIVELQITCALLRHDGQHNLQPARALLQNQTGARYPHMWGSVGGLFWMLSGTQCSAVSRLHSAPTAAQEIQFCGISDFS